ncbi:MAG: hypothetical protein RR296_11175, partial [Clostridia bacterium]
MNAAQATRLSSRSFCHLPASPSRRLSSPHFVIYPRRHLSPPAAIPAHRLRPSKMMKERREGEVNFRRIRLTKSEGVAA